MSRDPYPKNWRPIRLPFAHLTNSFVSGEQEEERFQVNYFLQENSQDLLACLYFGQLTEGPPGHVHGGAQAAVLDELCGGVAWTHGHAVLAVQLQCEFLKAVPFQSTYLGRGRFDAQEGRKIFTSAEICTWPSEEQVKSKKEPQIFARATGLFLILTDEQKQNFAFFDDEKLNHLKNLHNI